MRANVKRRLLIASAATALAAVTAGCSASAATTTSSPNPGNTGLVVINTSKYEGNIITPVQKPVGTLMASSTGKPFNIRTDTSGIVTLLFFGYTHCPDECPLTMSNTAAALRSIPAKDAAKVRVLFISVDPSEDTLTRLKSWLGSFNKSFIGLRASLTEVEALEKQTGLPVGQLFKDGDGYAQLDHATEMFAFSTDNVATEAFFPSTPPANMAHDLKLLVAGGKPS